MFLNRTCTEQEHEQERYELKIAVNFRNYKDFHNFNQQILIIMIYRFTKELNPKNIIIISS
jgi:hypothetical protein